MNKAEPLLSVVIPTRNRRDMALQAARSVLAKLPFSCEVILSDNASEDSTPNLEKLLPEVQYIRHSVPLSMAAHWNFCTSKAKGKYIKLLCDDDWILPGALEREVACLEADPTLAVVASARYEVNSSGNEVVALKTYSRNRRNLQGPALHFAMLLGENLLGPPSSVMFRRDFFRGFPEGYTYATDWAAWILLADSGGVAFLPEPGASFRLHEANLTLRHVESGTDFLEVQALRRECLRRIPGGKRWISAPLFAWIWIYRFSRRIARYLLQRNGSGLLLFLSEVKGYRAPALR